MRGSDYCIWELTDFAFCEGDNPSRVPTLRTAYVHTAIKTSSDCSACLGDNFKLVHQKEEFRHKPVNIWTCGIIIQDDGEPEGVI